MAEPDFRIKEYLGDRRALSELFALADDSPAAIEAYRDRGQLLVAVERQIVGLALIMLDTPASAAELKSIAVGPPHQGRGIGTALVAAAASAARKAGARSMTVSTAAADIDNLRFYQLAGFRMARIVRDAFTPATGYPGDLSIAGIPLRDQVVLDRTL